MDFNITERWAASWQTTYDFEHRNFASQVVSLQRDLYVTGGRSSPSPSRPGQLRLQFFLISLKAEPDLKFDYHKSTFKNEGF